MRNLTKLKRTKDQDGWVAQVGTGNCQSLFLTTRQIGAAVSKHSVITIWEVADEFVHKSDSASSDDLFASNILRMPSRRRTGQSHRDVVMDTHIEHYARLRDEGDMLAGEPFVEDSNVLLIEGDLSRLLGVHTSEQLSYSGLPGSRSANDKSGIAFREIHCHVVKDWNGGAGRVCEGDIGHLELSSALGGLYFLQFVDLSRKGDEVSRVARRSLGNWGFYHIEEGGHGSLALSQGEEVRGSHMEVTGGDEASPEDGHDLARSVMTISDKLRAIPEGLDEHGHHEELGKSHSDTP